MFDWLIFSNDISIITDVLIIESWIFMFYVTKKNTYCIFGILIIIIRGDATLY